MVGQAWLDSSSSIHQRACSISLLDITMRLSRLSFVVFYLVKLAAVRVGIAVSKGWDGLGLVLFHS